MDQDRAKWTQYLYGVNWKDPELYDLVLNLEYMDIKEACDIVTAAARQRCFQETPESQVTMENLALASRIRASLVTNPATADLEVEVAAHAGSVTIRGDLSNHNAAREVQRVAWQVPGVSELHLSGETGPAETKP
jgi:hypothetical protein